jgi:tetratricopeptide (TPR) repeat protein
VRHHVPPERRDSLLAALEEYRAGLRADRDQAAAEMNLGNLAQDLGDTAAAVRHYQTALQREDYLATARFNLALLYTQQGQHDLAAQQYRHLIEQLPTAPILERERQPLLALAHHRLGLVQAVSKNFEDAEASLRQAHRMQPDNFHFLYALGVLHLQTRDWQRARHYAEQLVRKFPDDRRAQVLLRDAIRQQAPEG